MAQEGDRFGWTHCLNIKRPAAAVGILSAQTVALIAHVRKLIMHEVSYWLTKLRTCWSGFLSTLKVALGINERQHWAELSKNGRQEMAEPTWKTLDLEEQGSRYQHYRELYDFWENGLVAIAAINPKYVGRSEEIKKEQLTSATALLRIRMDQLSNYDTKKFELQRVVEDIEMCRQYDKAEKERLTKGSNKSDPEAPSV